MTARLARIASHRQELIERSHAQRHVLADSLAPWRAPMVLAERGLAGLRFLGRHPVWLLAGLALLVRGPALGRKWLQRSWLIWRVVQTLRRR
jgi:hypothetical protein